EPLTACHELREYNAGQIEESDRDHRRAIRRMSWGLALVGSLGSIAGLVLGYGLTRGLRRTIHQFLVRVQGASDLLGQELPAVEWDPVGGRPEDGTDDLVRRVEQVVQKLHQREREVRRAERLAALGQLAAGVAHEVRNPLAAVILLVETGRRDPAAGGLTDEDLDLIEQELHRIERSLRGFLDYARPPRPQPRACALADVVRDAVPLTRGRPRGGRHGAGAGGSTTRDHSPSLPPRTRAPPRRSRAASAGGLEPGSQRARRHAGRRRSLRGRGPAGSSIRGIDRRRSRTGDF